MGAIRSGVAGLRYDRLHQEYTREAWGPVCRNPWTIDQNRNDLGPVRFYAPQITVTAPSTPLTAHSSESGRTYALNRLIFGVSDAALLDVLTGAARPEGRLPFELPSSMQEVEAQRSDVPHDTAHPLYRIGYGRRYSRGTR